MTWNGKKVLLADETRFVTLNGLWTGKKPPFVDAGVIRNTNFTDSGSIDYSDVAWLQVEQKQLANRTLIPGDIIIERSGGGPKQPVGRVVYFDRVDGPFSFSNFTSAIRTIDSENFDSKFVFYRLLELYQSGQTEDIQRRTTGIRNLDFSAYKSRASFPDIPIGEQRKIASVLKLVQLAIDQHERLVALTIELRNALLHQLLTKGLRGESQRQAEVGLVPVNWKLSPLEKAGEVIYGIQAAVASNLKPIGTKILTNKNITLDGKINLDTVNYFELRTPRHHATVLQKGDLLFNWRSGSKEHVGKTAYFDLDGEFTHSSFILRIRPHDHTTGRFLYYYLNHLRESGFFVKSQTFSINAKFNKSAVNQLPTFLPSEDERKDIIEVLDGVEAKLEFVESKCRVLKDLFRTVLHELITGRVRVSDIVFPEMEVAAAVTGAH